MCKKIHRQVSPLDVWLRSYPLVYYMQIVPAGIHIAPAGIESIPTGIDIIPEGMHADPAFMKKLEMQVKFTMQLVL